MTTETFTISRSGKASIKKDPDEKLDYTWDWTEWLNLVSDTIDDHSIIVSDTVVNESSAIDGSGLTVTAFLSGGTAGNDVPVTCRITTAGGRIADRSIYLKIRER